MYEIANIPEMSNPSKTGWLGFQEMSSTRCIMTKERHKHCFLLPQEI